MNGDVGGQNDLNQLNPANIERIEIVKGAASSLYGSDAIAGVINIITKRNREKMELTNTSRIGEYGDIRQSTSFGFNYGKIKSVTGIKLPAYRSAGGIQTCSGSESIEIRLYYVDRKPFFKLYPVREH